MGALRQVPGLGALLEKANLCVMGDVRPGPTAVDTLKRRFRAAMLNTFDTYGAHDYQHHLSDDEVRTIVNRLQPREDKVLNTTAYFARPPLIGCALRVVR
jgi:hypothetical protein